MRKEGSSTGAVVEVVAEGVPAGLGEPVYDKLDADLAKAMMSINAVKSVEIGAGLAAAALSGEENADEMRMKGEAVEFLSNNAGGILGGISTGQQIVARFAVKPTSSILSPRRTIDKSGAETEIVGNEQMKKETAEQWMRTVDTRTADYLRIRFALEAAKTHP